MRDRRYFAYMMASRSRVLYIGMTNNMVRRDAEHKERKSDSFTAKHRCTHLVWYEIYHSPTAAIAREKQLKGWTRAKKIALIEQTNPDWRDLSEDWGKPIELYKEPAPAKDEKSSQPTFNTLSS
jgi:putative endonuclease